jgi:hypothetical protein
VLPVDATLTSSCGQGQYAIANGPVQVTGVNPDNSQLRISLTYVATAFPPTVITCQTDGTFTNMFPC